MDLEIIIQPDGRILVPRGNSGSNQFLLSLFRDIIESDCYESLREFLSIADEYEPIYGNFSLCG